MKKILILLFFTALLVSCASDKSQKSDEGTITYTITYPKSIQDNGLSAFLPDEMTTIHKGSYSKINIRGELNMFNLDFISRANGDTCFTLFRIFDKKLYYPQKENENIFLFQNLGTPQFTYYNDSTKTIAGTLCRMGKITFDRPGTESRFYYTEEIDLEINLKNSPFESIPGTLMEFNINYHGIDFAFKAKSYKVKSINPDEFVLPENYRQTDAREINEIISSLMQL